MKLREDNHFSGLSLYRLNYFVQTVFKTSKKMGYKIDRTKSRFKNKDNKTLNL